MFHNSHLNIAKGMFHTQNCSAAAYHEIHLLLIIIILALLDVIYILEIINLTLTNE